MRAGCLYSQSPDHDDVPESEHYINTQGQRGQCVPGGAVLVKLELATQQPIRSQNPLVTDQ